jgi:hypothetical protein
MDWSVAMKALLAAALLMLTCTLVHAVDLADPTQPTGLALSKNSAQTEVSAEQASPLVLHSVLMGRARRVAVVNDRVLGVGDAIEQHVVVAIDDSSVTLEQAGALLTLKLRENVIRLRTPKP